MYIHNAVHIICMPVHNLVVHMVESVTHCVIITNPFAAADSIWSCVVGLPAQFPKGTYKRLRNNCMYM